MSDIRKQNRFRTLLGALKERQSENKKSFKEILKDLADSSSLHGVPRIVASRQITVKVLWCMLFVATCTVLGYQLSGLFKTYYSYPIQTTTSLQFSPIRFPAISICNMNPVRLSKLNMSATLSETFYDTENKPMNTNSSFYPSTEDDDYYDYSYNNDYDYDGSYIEDQLEGQKDVWDKLAEVFRIAIKKENMSKRLEMGHQKEDFIISAYYAGSQENVKYFRTFTSYVYGNCYTIFSRRYIAWRTGAAYGIKLTLNLEPDEYASGFSSGYGVRLVLHEPGTYPLPLNEGITLSPGTETSIGLRMVHISRLGPPYSECTPGTEFATRYRKKYSSAACDHFCRISKAMEVCNCIPVNSPDEIELNKTSLPVCNTTIRFVKLCLLEQDVQFNNGTFSCNCHGPCEETIYQKTMSSSYWPTPDYTERLLLDICTRKNQSENVTELPEFCGYFTSAPNDDNFDFADSYRHDFLRVLIYFEDLNYETITQEPMYEGIRFLSDIGGTMGLFLGASVLSLVEVLQLLLEIVLHIKKKIRKRNETTTVQVIAKQKNLRNRQ